MCLAIPGKVIEVLGAETQLARAEVGGVRRNINISLVARDDDGIKAGDWVLIHVGFALSKIDETEAQSTLRALEEIGTAYQQELEDIEGSRIE